MKRVRIWLVLAVAALAAATTPAAAEWNFDLYGGGAWVENTDLKVRGQGSNGAEAHLTIFDIDTDPGFTFGLRTGYWLDSLPWLGFDFDLFYIDAPLPAQTRVGTGALTGELFGKPISVSASGTASIPKAFVPILGFAPEVRFRLPLLVDSAFPAGRLQPYISAGPSWAFSVKNNSVAVEIGGKIGGGLAYAFTPWLALFTEYRYAFYPSFKVTDQNLSYTGDLKTHSVVGGISFRF